MIILNFRQGACFHQYTNWVFLLTLRKWMCRMAESGYYCYLDWRIKVVTDLNNILYYQLDRTRPSLFQNTYRKAVWSFLSDYPMASSITLSTQTTLWHQLYSGRGLTANLNSEHAEKKRCSLPSRHLILVYRLCHLCLEYPVEDITYDPHASEGWCILKMFSDMYLQAPL